MLQTGVPNLDLILGGGIPERGVLLVTGPAGSGKSTLALQMAFHTTSSGQNVLFVSTLSESPMMLIQHARSFAFFNENLIGKNLFLLSVYPLVKQGLEKVTDALIQAAREHEARLVVIDGLMTIRDLHPRAIERRSFIYELGATLATMDATLMVTGSEVESEAARQFPELTMADGVIELGEQDIGTRTIRTVRIKKMRGMAPLLGQHTLRIDSSGLSVFPRLESVFSPGDVGTEQGRVSTGLSELDEMMFGGLPKGSVTLLSGAMGMGKTLACLQYILAGVKTGEKGLMVGFRENPRQLFDKARSFGMDLETPVRAGQVAILSRPQADLSIDEVTWEMVSEIDRIVPQRLALDSIVELEYAMEEEKRRRGYMSCLASLLRGKGLTSLITREISKVMGPELDFSDTPLAFLAENLLLMRFVEFRSELLRVISIIKMRDSAHDHSIRQYTIGDEGIKVLTKIETAEGVLTGIARLPSEARVRRTGAPRREEGV